MRKKISSVILNIVLLLMGVVTVYPFVWMLSSSFKKNNEIKQTGRPFRPYEYGKKGKNIPESRAA